MIWAILVSVAFAGEPPRALECRFVEVVLEAPLAVLRDTVDTSLYRLVVVVPEDARAGDTLLVQDTYINITPDQYRQSKRIDATQQKLDALDEKLKLLEKK